jgi:lysophospholipase L1-like esterase
VPDYPNAVIADWKSASKAHPEYFVSDGIHLTGEGARAFAALVKEAAQPRSATATPSATP